MKTASWVIVRNSNGEAVLETFNEEVAKAYNTKLYRAVPILDYLVNFNKSVTAIA